MRSCYFFDMDSTLLEMDQDKFIYVYFDAIKKHLSKENYNVEEFMNDFNKAVYLILKNDGKMTNEELFYKSMSEKYDVNKVYETFNNFYNGPYLKLNYVVEKTKNPREIIDKLKKKNKRLVLATAPLFPYEAIVSRLRWAGLEPSDFEFITNYSNSSYSKPKKEYYLEILDKLNLKPEDCYMVGNDLDDDFCDLPDGFEKILITDHMLNRKNKEINKDDFFMISTLSEFNKTI
ncbi:MAG: HAD family hydrolase [Acholeplasmatales bacterium]|nr:HAD family hydrolase [Acholeplasmatales bacterium]